MDVVLRQQGRENREMHLLTNRFSRTTLAHLLAQRNCARAAHLLLDTLERQKKATVLRDSAQHTPLHIAAANDCVRIVGE